MPTQEHVTPEAAAVLIAKLEARPWQPAVVAARLALRDPAAPALVPGQPVSPAEHERRLQQLFALCRWVMEIDDALAYLVKNATGDAQIETAAPTA